MAYTRINWQDLPSTATPRNATNLNKMDSAIKEHDDKLLGNASMGDVVVDSIRTKNMFDKNSLINGSINSTTGAYTYQNYIVVSDYIWLSAGTYTIKMNNSSNIYLHTSCAYNSSKTYSSTLWDETTNTQRTFTLSADSYVRISFRNTSYSAITPSDVGNTNIQLEKGTTATTYSPYQNLTGDAKNVDGHRVWIGTKVLTFSSGQATWDITEFGLSSKPRCLVLTSNSSILAMQYDYDNSSATSVILKLSGSWNGAYRFSYILTT